MDKILFKIRYFLLWDKTALWGPPEVFWDRTDENLHIAYNIFKYLFYIDFYLWFEYHLTRSITTILIVNMFLIFGLALALISSIRYVRYVRFKYSSLKLTAHKLVFFGNVLYFPIIILFYRSLLSSTLL